MKFLATRRRTHKLVVVVVGPIFLVCAFAKSVRTIMGLKSVASTAIRTRRLVWHRNRDLRYHDHPFYGDSQEAVSTKSLFVFDDAMGCGLRPSKLSKQWKSANLGPHGMRVLLESVEDLRRSSRKWTSLGLLDQELIIRRGPTVPTLLELIEHLIRLDASNENQGHSVLYEICWNEEPGWYEQELSKELIEAISDRFGGRVQIKTDFSVALYHPDDLPQPSTWQPLSKKEKRRLENQRKRKQQLQGKASPNRKVDAPNNTQRTDAVHSRDDCNFVSVSAERWAGMPKIMGDFRRVARERAGVRRCNGSLDPLVATDSKEQNTKDSCDPKLNTCSDQTIDPGKMPTLESLLEPLFFFLEEESKKTEHESSYSILGLSPSLIQNACENALRIHHRNIQCEGQESPTQTSTMMGGETMALAHLDNFCQHHLFRAQRSLACVDDHQSSHLGQYLAFGCLSPRKVVEVANEAIESRRPAQPCETENDGTWLVSHMTMRDFFLYTCLASGTNFYRSKGIPVNQKLAASISWKALDDPRTIPDWQSWASGETGLPLVDACLKEMIQTGYASNRVRQNAASVLTKDLGIDWRMGAEWYQFLLSDHCVAANWGNWLYFSGVGPDPKQRHFCTISQALKYDAHGVYVRKWIEGFEASQGSGDNDEFHLRPWDFDPSWKRPMVDPDSQYTWRDLQRLKETGSLLDIERKERV